MAGVAAQLAGMALMPYYNEIIRIMKENDSITNTITGILHQLKYAALCLVIGGIVLGPPGAFLGGIIGSVYGYMTVHSYSNMIKVIRSMSDDEKDHLVNGVKELVGSDSVDALRNFVVNQANRNAFLGLVTGLVTGKSAGGDTYQQKPHAM